MVLEGYRQRLDLFFDPLSRALINVNPNIISFSSLLFAVLAGASLALSGRWLPEGSGEGTDARIDDERTRSAGAAPGAVRIDPDPAWTRSGRDRAPPGGVPSGVDRVAPGDAPSGADRVAPGDAPSGADRAPPG
ncbi:MAG TPA: hypothetical protein ENK47_02030, partial [Euryarchaeota archaeon]|nr:hypothetical protein [Euryarchaeota archaeon]